MKWELERYVRWYTRNNPEWSVMDWRARGLFGLILREVDRAGVLKLGKLGLKAVAVQVRAPWADIEPHLRELLEDGCIQFREDAECLLIPNFVEAQEARLSANARQQAARERAKAFETAMSLGVTGPSRHVTESHTKASQDVTEGHASTSAGHSSRAKPAKPAEPNQPAKPAEAASDKDQIRDRIRSHREFDGLDADRLAEVQLGFMITTGRRVPWVLTAIDECAAKTPSGLTAEALQAKLVGFMRNAKAPRFDAERKPATAVAQSAEIPADRAETLRKAQAEKRAKAEAARALAESIHANGGKHA